MFSIELGHHSRNDAMRISRLVAPANERSQASDGNFGDLGHCI